MNHLARSLRWTEDARTEPLFRDALAIRRQRLGDRHPAPLESMFNLAKWLLDRGRDDEAASRPDDAAECACQTLRA